MIKKLLTLVCVLTTVVSAKAITYTYGEFDAQAGTCTLMSWGGSQPTSGKLTLKETYVQDGVTYRVTAIAPHALDNLTQVTEITIPANVTKIGGSYCQHDSNGTTYGMRSCQNFFNCPELRLFYVAQGSQSFAASGAGVLMFAKGNIIVKVPQKVATASGRFNMSRSVTGICNDAFAENSTIKVLALSDKLYDAVGLGFSSMTALTDFAIVDNLTNNYLTVSNGVLYNADKTSLISFPPYRPVPSYSIPAGVKKIEDKAFANAGALYQVDLPSSINEVGDYAFSKSGITNITFPVNTASVGKGALSGCPRLTNITVNPCLALPADFARDCKVLSAVTLPRSAVSLGDCAFKNCPRLESFPFSITIDVERSDSVFADCGFKSVIYQPSQISVEGSYICKEMFYGNHNLELLDLSNIDVEGVDTSYLLFFELYAVGDCPALKTVKFPSGVSFPYLGSGLYPNFGINSPVETLVMGSFRAVNPPVIYYNEGSHSPKVYMQTTGCKMRRWALDKLFQTAGSATCSPVIYCEDYTMSDVQGHANEYICPQATYYIPGGTSDNYSGAALHAKGTNEMYRYRPVNNNGKFRLNISRTIAELEFTRISINNATQDIGMPDAYGAITTDIPVDNVDNVTVEYTVNGIAMKTVYPTNGLSSGIGYVADDTQSLTVIVSGNTAYFGNICQYSVADMSGRIIITGNDDNADLSGLTAGVYIINAIDADHHKVTRKHTVR